MKNLLITAAAITLCLFAIPSSAASPEGYRVTKYSSRTHEWTIIKTGNLDGEFQTKKIVAVCEWSHDDTNHPHWVWGADACYLPVGQFMFLPFTHHPGAAYWADDNGSQLFVTQIFGDKDTMTWVFHIESIELLNYTEGGR